MYEVSQKDISQLEITEKEKAVLRKAYEEPQPVELIIQSLNVGGSKAYQILGMWEYNQWVTRIRAKGERKSKFIVDKRFLTNGPIYQT